MMSLFYMVDNMSSCIEFMKDEGWIVWCCFCLVWMYYLFIKCVLRYGWCYGNIGVLCVGVLYGWSWCFVVVLLVYEFSMKDVCLINLMNSLNIIKWFIEKIKLMIYMRDYLISYRMFLCGCDIRLICRFLI